MALFKAQHLVVVQCLPFSSLKIFEIFLDYFLVGTKDRVSFLGRPTFYPHTCLSEISLPHQSMLGVLAW